ncbi:photosystem P840 reaction-center cytochrome c-551 [Geomesophilobacter sediminis]|uniref:Cytochrome C n=1 Tax=Geomesophilobacter sediminis TaxID=2798584 RepID=A0A8J7JFU2_9BACT|nr:photosystem P840 reaction-center cytochrome c-551 [Geomesophilobacter sediminis]MBJ6725289.1 cytochrome C [Geomesophilobacter sediminis]
MKRRMLFAALAIAVSATSGWALEDTRASGSNLGSVSGGDFKSAHQVMERRCTSCHGIKRIEDAFKAKKDMAAIEQRMMMKGAKLSQKEREVLGIYWKTPLKK